MYGLVPVVLDVIGAEGEDPATISIVDALSGAVTAIVEQVGGALPIALPVAGAILAATIGWRLFKRFVRG